MCFLVSNSQLSCPSETCCIMESSYQIDITMCQTKHWYDPDFFSPTNLTHQSSFSGVGVWVQGRGVFFYHRGLSRMVCQERNDWYGMVCSIWNQNKLQILVIVEYLWQLAAVCTCPYVTPQKNHILSHKVLAQILLIAFLADCWRCYVGEDGSRVKSAKARWHVWPGGRIQKSQNRRIKFGDQVSNITCWSSRGALRDGTCFTCITIFIIRLIFAWTFRKSTCCVAACLHGYK